MSQNTSQRETLTNVCAVVVVVLPRGGTVIIWGSEPPGGKPNGAVGVLGCRNAGVGGISPVSHAEKHVVRTSIR